MNIFFNLSFPRAGVKTQLSWALCFTVSHKAEIKVLARAEVSSEAQMEKDLL